MNQSSTSVTINLRNKGIRNTAGTLVKGCVKDATTKLSIGSIPSNYQTIIYQHNSTKAFGSSQKRFYQENKTEIDKSITLDDSIQNLPSPQNHASHSTKGYGPLIARQQRNWIPKNCSPGPGRYQYAKTAEADIKRQKKKKYPPTFTALSKKQNNINSENQTRNQKKQTPGPGEYSVFQQRSINNGWKSAFKTKFNRFSYIPNNLTPGPGFYDIKFAQQRKSPVKQGKQNMNLYSPEKLHPNKIFQVLQKPCKDQIPGPGSYDHEIPTFKPLYERIKISGNFMCTKKDRFNDDLENEKYHNYFQDSPNIYSYNQKSSFDKQKRLLKWPCFMSQSKRTVFNGQNKLGPSFLMPKVQTKKNCHFNIKGEWI